MDNLFDIDNKVGRYKHRWILLESAFSGLEVKTARCIEEERDGPQWVHKTRTPTKASRDRLERLLMHNEAATAVLLDDGILIEFNPGDHRVEVQQDEG